MKQRAINSYFTKKSETKETQPPSQTKRKAPTISSDEEDTPQKVNSIASKRHKTSKIVSTTKVQSTNLVQKLKPADVKAVFGGKTTRETKKGDRIKVTPNHETGSTKVSNTTSKTSKGKQKTIKTNDEQQETLMESPNLLDDSISYFEDYAASSEISKKRKYDSLEPQRRSSRTSKKSPKILDSYTSSNRSIAKNINFDEQAETFASNKDDIQRRSTKKLTKALDTSDKKIKVQIDHSFDSSDGNETYKSIQKHKHNLETSIISDEERFERKRMAAALYQKYKNRESVINPGSKAVPKGKPNCLAGLSFCVTGVLESIDRDEAGSIIKELGGKVSGTVGKRLNYLIAGEESGPKKLATAEDMGIPILNVDGFFDLIRTKSNITLKNAVIQVDKTTLEKKNITKINQDKLDTDVINIREEKRDIEVKEMKEEKQEVINIEVKDETNTLTKKGKPDIENIAWVDKYKPTTVKQIIGQQGPASNCAKLINWLKNWHPNQSGTKKLQKPNPWAKNDDGSYFKAALLSGPPGVGKTTTATLVCKELGFDIVEFNASDTRSKRLLKEEVSELLSNKSLFGYFHGEMHTASKKHVLIMDEVDGMAGNEDRGGIQELIGLIKDAHVPVICMCNDRNHQKLRSLVNYCYDLRFSKPRLEQIKGFIKSICFKEKVKLSSEKIEEIIMATNNDVRQSINHLCLISAVKELVCGSIDNENRKKTAQKDLKMGPWEIVRKVFSAEEHKIMSFQDKSDLFFHDYSMAPLFVQQNYLIVSPQGPKSEVLKKVAMTAEALSLGDTVDRRIRTNSAWTLLPVQAVFSSVLPGEYMGGFIAGQINFPGWLGKYSRANKRSRLAQEIHDHTRLRTSGSRLSIRMDYAPFLLSNIVRPLKEEGLAGVEKSLNVLQEYRLLKEDVDSLIELTTWPGKKSQMDSVDGRLKAALTRAYNKEVLPYSYSAATAVKKKKHEVGDDNLMDIMEGEGEERIAAESDDENENSLENDNLIRTKVNGASKTSSVKASSLKNAGVARKPKGKK